ncbi:hypothetical protein B5E53_10345 [Eubacterium sp. An11]|nr:hypothetical protein B5E53_10345 [Eubacterium sp. An11]
MYARRPGCIFVADHQLMPGHRVRIYARQPGCISAGFRQFCRGPASVVHEGNGERERRKNAWKGP